MQPVNKSDDVERLLDVLGVPSLPYQSFRKSIDTGPSGPGQAASTCIETCLPLLAAALPEFSGAVISRRTDIKQPAPPVERPPQSTSDDAVPPFGHSVTVVAPPANLPLPTRTAPAKSAPSVFHKPTSASLLPTAQAPPNPAETPLREVFKILRFAPVLPEAETASQRGIRTLFDRL